MGLYPSGVTTIGYDDDLSDFFRGWLGDDEGEDRHFVYHLCTQLPGISPVEKIAHIYVGVTNNPRRRFAEHARKWWWWAVDLRLSEIIGYPTRQEAESAERQMIHDYQPAMNRAGRLLLVDSL